MQIRNAETADRNTLHCIYAYAREQMAMNGNANQWIAGYPSDELIDEDITQGHSYVCLADDGHIAGVFCWWVGEEPTYAEIYDGKWLDDEPYGVIHRIASDGTVHGLMNFCLQWCMERHPNIRIDTHTKITGLCNICYKNPVSLIAESSAHTMERHDWLTRNAAQILTESKLNIID